MGTSQATLNDFITAAVNAYGGPNAPAMGVQWTPVTSAQLDALNSNSLGYSGEAWVNESTGEVMIANEGTVPTNTANLLSDTQLSMTAVPAAQAISNTFAQQAIVTAEQMLQGTGVSVTAVDLTGHSLGGYEGQGNTVFLSNLTNNDVQGFSGITYTNVSFDAPGIGGIDQSGVNTSLYTSYNFSAQGDIIHLAGGDELQGTVDVSLPVGTPMWASGGLVVAGSTLSDTGVGSLIGGGLLALGLDNALDNHFSLLLQGGVSPTVLGTTEVSQYAGLTPAQLQSLYGAPSAPTSPVYDAAGYDQNGYNQDGYNIFGLNVNGNLDPSIAADGGEVNTDTLSDGSTITVNIAANGSSTATLDEADGTVNTYTYNTSVPPPTNHPRRKDVKYLASQACEPIFSRMSMKLLLALALMGISFGSLAASFDCDHAGTKIEKIICGDRGLSSADSQLGTAYQMQLQDSVGVPRDALIAAQKDWIRNVRDRCQDNACLSHVYLVRLRSLLHIDSPSSDADYVIDKNLISSQIEFFQNELQRLGIPGKLTSCPRLIRLNSNSISGIAADNASYGAICNLGINGIRICENRMVGGLSIKYGSVYVAKAIADFTQANCPYGG